ncbi:hypothetical protein KSP39_PZI002308 [Platanthera zijinensis]|uniref:Uncharacterized protein n=1 Tax=Platanthera zijinensis TaxID=2320716 RepID=A0AAP0BXH8_9ASPA
MIVSAPWYSESSHSQTSSSGWVLSVSTTRKNPKGMETATHYGSWPRQCPRHMGDQSNRERLDDDARPGTQPRFLTVHFASFVPPLRLPCGLAHSSFRPSSDTDPPFQQCLPIWEEAPQEA